MGLFFFSGGVITERFVSWRYFHLGLYILVICLANMFLTYSPLWLFFVLCFFNGWATGATDSAGNVLALDIWRGHGGEHWMHFLHFRWVCRHQDIAIHHLFASGKELRINKEFGLALYWYSDLFVRFFG